MGPYIIVIIRPSVFNYLGARGVSFRRAVAALDRASVKAALIDLNVPDAAQHAERIERGAAQPGEVESPLTDGKIAVEATSWRFLAREGGVPSQADAAHGNKAHYRDQAQQSILTAVNGRWSK